jgi:hypothetical protein
MHRSSSDPAHCKQSMHCCILCADRAPGLPMYVSSEAKDYRCNIDDVNHHTLRVGTLSPFDGVLTSPA